MFMACDTEPNAASQCAEDGMSVAGSRTDQISSWIKRSLQVSFSSDY
jgi:hypothetical protein